MALKEYSISLENKNLKSIFGELDYYLKKIEKAFHVTIIARNDAVKIIGDEKDVALTEKTIIKLLDIEEKNKEVTEHDVDYSISLCLEDRIGDMPVTDKETICHTVMGKPVAPKTIGQKDYVDAIRKKMIVFGLGPAGTGKTYLAMAMAITAFKNEEVSKIILTRPAIEAGEKLGFLPGDLQSKVDPYLRPLYDALYQIMGADSFMKNMEKGLIEVAPLAYMRGRTLDNAFIILDEAQNTTPAQMKMFLTRIGFGSKVVITGDVTQKDLGPQVESGLDVALKVLKNVEEIGIIKLTSKDVVRHPLVQKIVLAYEEFEKKSSKKDISDKPSVKRAKRSIDRRN
ncbi:MAG: PhoH family protein [Lachnospiraceae bacterium]|nr:PhoH family protein [Lachnospiraceae bacterium]